MDVPCIPPARLCAKSILGNEPGNVNSMAMYITTSPPSGKRRVLLSNHSKCLNCHPSVALHCHTLIHVEILTKRPLPACLQRLRTQH